VSEYWHAESHSSVPEFLQELREQGKIGLANNGEGIHSSSIHHIAQTLSKGAAVVMLQEVSFHPGERRRIKNILKTVGLEYWCIMETSQRVRAGQEELKVGVSKKNYLSQWVYSVVTFLHKDVFKQPIRVDWAGQ
jgi:hypothetical protein